MSVSTRLGGNATGLPGEPLTRRRLLRGAAPLAIGLAAVPSLATVAGAAPLSANDIRLIALADAYEAADAACNAHAAAHQGCATEETDAAFGDLCAPFTPIEEEIAATPADSMAGILAKARAAQVPTMRDYAGLEALGSLADDVWRLFGGRVA